jgi:heme-degrading monooxygenase HmoA
VGQKESDVYAAIRKYELDAGSVDELAKRVDAGLARTLSTQPGFLAYHVIASGVSMTGGEEIVSVTFFEDEETAARSNELAAQFVKDELSEFGLHLNSAMSGVILVSRTADMVSA